jgi:hypothetical protein
MVFAPLDVGYRWREADKSVASHPETIYAVLNGPYNDGESESGRRLKF